MFEKPKVFNNIVEQLKFSQISTLMKTKLLTLILFVMMSILTVFAQTDSSVLSKLQGKRWRMDLVGDTSLVYYIQISTDSIKSTGIYNGVSASIREPFYLSDQIVSAFDNSKIGTAQNGRYMIVKVNSSNPLRVFEIVELTENRLLLKNLMNSSLMKYTSY